MKDLITRSYNAIRKRGLITDETKNSEFIEKIMEELEEVHEATIIGTQENYIEELTDLATVCIMNIHHLGYDFEAEFEKVLQKNEQRANSINKPL